MLILTGIFPQQSFMSAGSVTLGGNLSIAVGPLGRNGEASGTLNTKGKMAAMYSYSKTRGLFGGVSLEGSVIVERSDANAQAYRHDVTAKMLLSGSIPPPEWASVLIGTLEQCTGMPGNRRWVSDRYNNNSYDDDYMFDGVGGSENGPSRRGSTARPSNSRSNSYFDYNEDGAGGNNDLYGGSTNTPGRGNKHAWANASAYRGDRQERDRFDRDEPTTEFFDTKFQSDFVSEDELRKHPRLSSSQSRGSAAYPFQSIGSGSSNNTTDAPRARTHHHLVMMTARIRSERITIMITVTRRADEDPDLALLGRAHTTSTATMWMTTVTCSAPRYPMLRRL